MLHLSSRGGKFDLIFNSSFTKLDKKNGVFVFFLCVLKCLYSFRGCMNVATVRNFQGGDKRRWFIGRSKLICFPFYYWCIL